MNLEGFMMKQVELNEYLDNSPTEEQLVAAITAELGEFMNSIKYGEYGWSWWPRPENKGSSRDEALGEYIDILHFLLVGYERYNKGALAYHQVMVNEYLDAPPPSFQEALYDHPFIILKNARERRYHLAIMGWLAMGKVFGFDEKQIDEGFARSVEKNLGRWTA
mgnify:CR=1 FL=1